MTEQCPFISEECKYFNNPQGCITSIHHQVWPRRDYTTPVEKAYRQLPENKFVICREMHDEIHALEEPPIKPSLDVMRHAIEESRVNRVLERQPQ